MAFRRAGWKAIGGQGQAYEDGKVFFYINTADTLATILASGYFNSVSNDLDANYTVYVRGSDGDALVKLVRDSTGLILTAESTVLPVAGGAALSLTTALHNNKTILFDTAAGTVLTLPASTGNGAKFRCVVSVLATSNSHILQCVGTDMMQGACGIIDTDTADATIQFAALVGDTFDTITMNRTTTGLAAPGDWVEVEDVVAGVWAVRGLIRASGAVATPFSSAV